MEGSVHVLRQALSAHVETSWGMLTHGSVVTSCWLNMYSLVIAAIHVNRPTLSRIVTRTLMVSLDRVRHVKITGTTNSAASAKMPIPDCAKINSRMGLMRTHEPLMDCRQKWLGRWCQWTVRRMVKKGGSRNRVAQYEEDACESEVQQRVKCHDEPEYRVGFPYVVLGYCSNRLEEGILQSVRRRRINRSPARRVKKSPLRNTSIDVVTCCIHSCQNN